MSTSKGRLGCGHHSRVLALIIWPVAVAALGPIVPLAAQGENNVRESPIPATGYLVAEPPQLRTLEDILQDAATRRSDGAQKIAPRRFRPTISDAQYKQLKAAAEASASIFRLASFGTLGFTQPLAPPVLTGVDIDGRDKTTSCSPATCFPPDTHGAVGPGTPFGKFVEVTNLTYDVFDASGTNLLSVPLRSLFATDAGDVVFSPRVLYDGTWNRWVLSLTRVANSTTTSMSPLWRIRQKMYT